MNREYIDFAMRGNGFWYICNGEEWRRATGIDPLVTSAVWASANQAVYTPIMVPEFARFASLFVYNGAVVNGNVDLGIYLPDSEGKPGARLGSTGATAQAGTSVWQQIAISGGAKATHKGLLYLACSFSGVTAQVTRMAALTVDGKGPFMASIFTEAAAHPLPANATPNAAGVVAAAPLLMTDIN